MPVMPHFMPIDANKVDWKIQAKYCEWRMPLGCPCMFVITTPFELPTADFGKVAWGVRAVEPRCEFESGANYFALRFPPRGRAYTEPQLFICLFAFAFADCHSIECICFSAAAMSQGLCWIHFPLVSTTPYTHVYTYILFCLPKMTNRRCARTSPPPMRNKDQRLHFEWLSNTELLQLVFMSCLNNWSQP